MYIDQAKCVACKRCIPYCPRSAITESAGKLTIDLDLCVECGVCKNNAKCPRDAIYNVHLESPRAYRKAFSDPFGKHENTALKHMGRGTEEVKTNDVTGVVNSLDYVSFAVELGRPNIGSTFADLEKVAMAVAPYAMAFEVNNPVTSLIVDKKTGKLDPSVLGESIMSAIVEFTCATENIKPLLEALKIVSQKIDTVFSVGIICRVDEKTDTIPARKIIDELGINVNKTSAKTNLGLGRPRYEDRVKEGI
jgi:Pyruvate:ferredoxin oxidoreductase and related 2-oxoacid:ferredoxin oxidoreductases, delta subunit